MTKQCAVECIFSYAYYKEQCGEKCLQETDKTAVSLWGKWRWTKWYCQGWLTYLWGIIIFEFLLLCVIEYLILNRCFYKVWRESSKCVVVQTGLTWASSAGTRHEGEPPSLETFLIWRPVCQGSTECYRQSSSPDVSKNFGSLGVCDNQNVSQGSL